MKMINAIIASLALSGVAAAGEQEMDVLDRVQAASCPHEVRDVGAFHGRVETR